MVDRRLWWTVACLLMLIMLPVAAVSGLDPLGQDDADSGRDAPGAVSQDITLVPDTVYEGSSPGPVLDNSDIYHITGEAGQRFQGWSDGNTGCFYLLDAQGQPYDGYPCSVSHVQADPSPMVLDLPYTGDYYVKVSHNAPSFYTFGYSLDDDPPAVHRFQLLNPSGAEADAQPQPIPAGCTGDFEMVPGTFGPIPRFTDDCYHMRTGLNSLDTADIDVLIVPPASPYAERDLRVMRQAIEMWDAGIHQLAAEMGLAWLDEGVDFDIFIDDDKVRTDPLWDPEIVVVASNPVGGAGIGIDPLQPLGIEGLCHGQPNPLASLDDWKRLPGFDSHHDGLSGTLTVECEGGGPICFAVNGAIEPLPFSFFGLYDLVAHEVGHCLTIGHVGDALDHKAEAVPFADIMAYTDRAHDKCVSTLDVESFAVTMSRYLLSAPTAANDAESDARGTFQIQHPDDHWYASPTGRPEDCPQPHDSLIP